MCSLPSVLLMGGYQLLDFLCVCVKGASLGCGFPSSIFCISVFVYILFQSDFVTNYLVSCIDICACLNENEKLVSGGKQLLG